MEKSVGKTHTRNGVKGIIVGSNHSTSESQGQYITAYRPVGFTSPTLVPDYGQRVPRDPTDPSPSPSGTNPVKAGTGRRLPS